jgi:hypothetical protein
LPLFEKEGSGEIFGSIVNSLVIAKMWNEDSSASPEQGDDRGFRFAYRKIASYQL